MYNGVEIEIDTISIWRFEEVRLDIFIMWEEKILCGIFFRVCTRTVFCLYIVQIWLGKPNWTRIQNLFFCLECDIKSFPNTYIEMEQKRMELKNDNKNKNRILLGQ